ncbi:hypothetical protein EBB07_02785 [Paenibacillaceae bacterium]|nr:hypothetical protein EBB07_02785 [Paenibacillaceae bacterium]
MNKKMVLIGTCAFLLGAAATASAGPVIKEIKAQINYGITMTLNGKTFAPQDAKGNDIKPITYQGTTYVPLRSVSEAFGIPVNYDGKNLKITLGEQDAETDVIKSGLYDKYPRDGYASLDIEALSVNGQSFKSGFIATPESRYTASYIQLLTNKQYAKLKFKVAVASDRTYNIFVKDAKTDVVYKEILNADSSQIYQIEADILAADKLKIEVIATTGEFGAKTKVVIGDIMAK